MASCYTYARFAYGRTTKAVQWGFVAGELGYTGHVPVVPSHGEPGQLLRISKQLEADGPIRIPRRTAYYRSSDRDSNRTELPFVFFTESLFPSDSITRLPRTREELRLTDVSELRVVSQRGNNCLIEAISSYSSRIRKMMLLR